MLVARLRDDVDSGMADMNEQDEDALYRRAEQELDDGSRDMEVWRRACGMASRDHDEARFLYQTLRVEQWLGGTDTPARPSADSDRSDDPLSDTDAASTVAPAAAKPDARQAHADLGPDGRGGDPAPPATGPDSVDDLDQDIELSDPPPHTNRSADAEPARSPDHDTTDRSSTAGHEAGRDPMHVVPADESDGPGHARKPVGTIDPLEAESRLPPVVSPVAAPTRPAVRGATAPDAGDSTDSIAPRHGRSAVARGAGSPAIQAARERRGRRYLVMRRGRGEFAATREGVSWLALFFTLPWLLWHGLIGTALTYVLLWIVLAGGLLIVALMGVAAPGDLSVPLQLLVIGYVLIAFAGLVYVPLRYANGWYRRRLERRGYEPLRPVRGVDRRDAIEQVRRAQRA